ncbi:MULTISPECIES: hypothetical protein [Agrobacterium]|uniref:DUF4126 domain-containing protein n=1 Tax=Agrobacterium tumefaciens TaxID=358 RepID=A0AAF0GZ59_AGRTU|nr:MULTISPECIES: hypothetical protein [Agrobacterium]WGM61078.1 DUF4126 domain-containing protein [Agrobacterium tumefaciens]CVI62927.1 putative membrane protein [Agrobacterium salinitolerans str. Hayward 0363]
MLVLFPVPSGIAVDLPTRTVPFTIIWGRYLGWFDISRNTLFFTGLLRAVTIFIVPGFAKPIADRFPGTPSHSVSMAFGACVVTGSIGRPTTAATAGTVAPRRFTGVIGAVTETLGGAISRFWLAHRFGLELPVALVEDTVIIAFALLVVVAVS